MEEKITKICSVDGCEEKSCSKGLCSMHYTRLKRHGDLNHTEHKDNWKGMSCFVEGCDRKIKGHGYCHMHLSRFKKHGDPSIVKTTQKYDGIKCYADGCERRPRSNGLCSKHLERFKRHGDPNFTEMNMHGMAYSEEYRIYIEMKKRCYDTNHLAYNRYGGRGIKICDRWLDNFENFYSDMGKRPFPKAQIDRRESDGNYSLDNCRWTTPTVNSRNRKSNKLNMEKAREIRKKEGKMSAQKIADIYGCSERNIRAVWENITWREDADLTCVDPNPISRSQAYPGSMPLPYLKA